MQGMFYGNTFDSGNFVYSTLGSQNLLWATSTRGTYKTGSGVPDCVVVFLSVTRIRISSTDRLA